MSLNFSNTTQAAVDEYVLVEELRIFLFILIQTVSLFGVVANVINMIIFYQLQGTDVININLLGLAVSDLAACLTTLIFMLFTNFWILEHLFTSYKINPVEVMYLIFGVPHTIFVRISVLLTALISFERCLCVVLPLKVKMILTFGRVKLLVALSFMICIIVSVPIFYVNRLEWVFHPMLNMSILRHVKTDQFYELNYWFTPMEGICLHLIPFIVVTVCTIVMVRSLKKRMEFRKSVTRTQSTEAVNREKKIAVMVAIMSTVFLICNLPNIGIFLIVSFYPSEFSLEIGASSDTGKILGFVPLLLDTFNSAINILIYYTNSSNYRVMFDKIFKVRKHC